MNNTLERLLAKVVAGLIFTLPLIVTDIQASDWPTGDDIAQHINARDEGKAVSRKLTMAMIDRSGKKRVRQTRGFRKYYGQEKRSVLFYLSPKNLKGTAFLTYDFPAKDRDDDQWLYLPAMRKVRRISAADRGDYFLGTDFTYEDIKLETKVSIEDYTRKTIGEDEVDGFHCYIVEALPVDEKTTRELGYSRVEQCVDDEIWMVRRSRFWDARGKLLKTILSEDIRQVQGIWTQHRIEVENHKTKHRTIFTFSEVDYATDVRDAVFTRKAIRRGL
ncbi:MAG: outer membrane lipoprotein-sorting protein [Gammaproteobacteria bacterium]|nr:outer membrane lipoprotein-sorting protein [Gammaproteobacteria bacterium]